MAYRFTTVLFLLSIVFCAGSLASSNQAKVDSYVDVILADANKLLIDTRQERLPIQSFQFKINSTGIGNRDVKANVTSGHFEGLKNIARRRPCKIIPPRAPPKGSRPDLAVPSNMTINCNATLAGVRAMVFNGTFKGDSLSGSIRNFTTLTVIDTADVNVTFVGRPGLKGHLTLTLLKKIVLTTTFPNPKQKPDLNKERIQNFTDELNRKLAKQLFDVVEGPYSKALATATARKVLPYLV